MNWFCLLQLDDLKEQEIQTLTEARDQALEDVKELRKAQATHEASILESRNLETTLKHHNNTLEKQVCANECSPILQTHINDLPIERNSISKS